MQMPSKFLQLDGHSFPSTSLSGGSPSKWGNPAIAVTGKTGEPTWKRQRKLKDNSPFQKSLKNIPGMKN